MKELSILKTPDIFLKIFVLCIMFLFFVTDGNAQMGWQQSFGQSPGQVLIKALKFKEPLTFCNEPVPFNEGDVKERLERELLVALSNSDDVILWIKRSHRYFPHIEKVLKNNSMPDDLKYIVITESHLKPMASSSKGAVGFWQFIEGTGSRYGMKINKDIDERRNFFISTDAAVAYLKDLYALFGSWTLAAAAYNMGEDGLKTEMLMQKVNNYYKLYLNQETQRYVFKILAAKMIISNPEKYGFFLTDEDFYKPLQFDQVEPLFHNLRAMYDYVFVDFGRALSRVSLPIIQGSDCVAMVLSPDISSVELTKSCLNFFLSRHVIKQRIFPIVNLAVGRQGMSRRDVEEELEIPVDGLVPYSEDSFTTSMNRGTPFVHSFHEHFAAGAIREMASRLLSRLTHIAF